ncbi:hypothetical protein ONZ45_g18911 [Pleurotus djamor]|nr:hypothetical protein ONZ45_g18911 [Pleurotus djamor]
MIQPPKPSLEKQTISEEELPWDSSQTEANNDADFGGEAGVPPPPTLSAEQEAKLWRKIDLRLMPILRFGHIAAISQLLTVPPYVFATIVLGFFAHYSDKLRMRSPFIMAGLFMCLIGFSINISEVASGVKYFGTFLVVAGSYAAFPGVVAWDGDNLSGQYKRAVRMAVQIGIGNLGAPISTEHKIVLGISLDVSVSSFLAIRDLC